MSNYQRLISYIYTYESGLKGKNVGFAKLETRNSQCRLTVNVKKVVPVGSPLGVYLLSGDGEQRIGTLFSRNGAGEFRALLNADRVEGSGRPLQEFFGLSIHEAENAGHSYTTIWEDAAMNAAEAVKKEEKNADRSQEKLQSRQEEERADQAEEIGPESEAEEALEKARERGRASREGRTEARSGEAGGRRGRNKAGRGKSRGGRGEKRSGRGENSSKRGENNSGRGPVQGRTGEGRGRNKTGDRGEKQAGKGGGARRRDKKSQCGSGTDSAGKSRKNRRSRGAGEKQYTGEAALPEYSAAHPDSFFPCAVWNRSRNRGYDGRQNRRYDGSQNGSQDRPAKRPPAFAPQTGRGNERQRVGGKPGGSKRP